jgi:hypothetical protein
LPGANVGSTQKEGLFSFVTDVGWVGVSIPDVRMANGEPSELLDANAPLRTNGESTQKELFSFVTDMGWAGVTIPDARMVDGEPGAFLEHDRVASFDTAHASSGGAFLL